MQTFLPFEDFQLTAKVLDNRRLGKQRIEVVQTLQCLWGFRQGWGHHPVCGMWRDFEEALGWYGVEICREWQSRGYKDQCEHQILSFFGGDIHWEPELPPWLGLLDLHVSHRSALVAKNPEFYGPLFPEVEPVVDYVWPVR